MVDEFPQSSARVRFWWLLFSFDNVVGMKCWLPTLSVNCTFIFLRLVYSSHVWIACSQPSNIWSIKLYVWYVCTCKYMHVCVWVHVHASGGQRSTVALIPHCSSSYFLRQDLPWTLELTDSGRLRVAELQGPSCLQHWGYWGTPSFEHGCWGCKLSSLRLCGRHFIDGAISLAPQMKT